MNFQIQNHRIEADVLKVFPELQTQKKVHNFLCVCFLLLFFYHQDFSFTSFSLPRYNTSNVKPDRNMEYCPKVVADGEIPSSAFFSPEICRLDWCTWTQCALTNSWGGLG